MAAIMLLSILMVPLVMSGVGNENATNVNEINDTSIAEQVCGYPSMVDMIISGAITNETNVSKLELPISIAATGDFAGRIAFTSNRENNNEIYVMNETNVTRLTKNTASDINPEWHPDGSKIAFSSNREIYWNIYVMNADGTDQEQLTYNNMDNLPGEWSPDGSKLLFFSDRDGDLDIYTMDADGTNVTQLTSTNHTVYYDFSPAWALGGEKIVFVSGRFVGDFEIYVMDADGTKLTRLTANFADDNEPVWAQSVCELPEICRQYDANYNCIIERHEVINAVNDYFDGVITIEQLITVINATAL